MEIKEVEFSRLVGAGAVNSRTTSPKAADAALVASIKAVGLLQPLLVREIPFDGENHLVTYEVIDGNRRLAALAKTIKKDVDPLIPVLVKRAGDLLALQSSVATNTIRAGLHPVEEYNAYAAMHAEGATTKQIATMYGVKEKWVRQRLQLVTLAPELRKQWLDDKMTEEQAQALSAAPDHALQLDVWKRAKSSGWEAQPSSLRRMMLAGGVEANDRRAALIGAEAYAAAGGRFSSDLFSESQVFFDVELLDRLVAERLAAEVKRYLDEGWSWAATPDELKVPIYQVKQIDRTPWATAEEIAAAEAGDYEGERKIKEAVFERAMADPEARAKSGVVVSLDHYGALATKFLCLDPRKPEEVEPPTNGNADDEGEKKESTNWALRQWTSEQMTIALSKALAEAPNGVALPAVIASLRMAMESYGPSLLRIDTRKAWRDLLPDRELAGGKSWASEFRRAIQMPHGDQLQELARLAARTVDARLVRYDHRSSRSAMLDEDMRKMTDEIAYELGTFEAHLAGFEFDEYFKRVSRADCEAALVEMGAGALKSAKKAEVATFAAQKARETGWLPREVRTIVYRGPGAEPWVDGGPAAKADAWVGANGKEAAE